MQANIALRLPPGRVRALLALTFGVLCLGFSGIFVALAAAPGAVTGFYRMGIAAVALAVPFWLGRAEFHRWTRRELLLAALGGVLFAGDLFFWNTGILISGPTTPTLLGNTAPVWVGLGTLFIFRTRLGRFFWPGLGLALVGAAIVLGIDARNNVGLGTFYGLLAGIFYGAYFLIVQRNRQRMSAVASLWLTCTAAALVLLTIIAISGASLIDYPPPTFAYFLGIGLIVQVFGHFAISYALGYLPASLVAPTLLGQPVLTGVFAFWLLGQPLSAGQIVGGACVVGGVYLVHRSGESADA